MKRKSLTSIMVVVGAIMLLTTSAWSNVPPPPVNQVLGIDDTTFNNLDQDDCRVCHMNTIDGHHMLYDQDIPQGMCSANGNTCIKADSTAESCQTDICSDSGVSCSADADCNPATTGQQCGEICIGGSAVINDDTDLDGNPDSTYTCLSCHPEIFVGGTIRFEVIRDCVVCHVQEIGQPTVHHRNEFGYAKNAVCSECHGDLVNDALGCAPTAQNACSIPLNGVDILCEVDADCPPTTGTCEPVSCDHEIPTYLPSLVTPAPSDGDGPDGSGACDYCHDAGLDTDSGVQVVDNNAAHHSTGIQITATGANDFDICEWCHFGDIDPMRDCENCHGFESLHNIQVDSNGDGEIDVGGELAGYGHVGRDAGVGDSDCWGCHGNYVPGAFAAASGPVVPFINSSDVSVMTAGTDTPVVLTGVAFTNMIMDFQWISDVLLTAADGSSVTLTPGSISQESLTVTIPGSMPAGNYKLQAIKGDLAKSNPVGIIIKPDVVITAVECTEDNLVITGTGFGDAPPQGAEEYINAKVGGMMADIISWTNTEIVAAVPFCSDAVTVNALFGSPTTCDCEGNFDGDEDTDGADIHTFKMDFGRNPLQIPCEDGATCSGDFDCDEDVDGSDAFKMKEDFGRSPLRNPCAPISVEQWCAY